MRQLLLYKNFLLLFFFLTSFIITNAPNLNGWEFLTWGMSTEEAETLLEQRNIVFVPYSFNHISPNTHIKDYKGFDTYLYYDKGLYNVQQYKRFVAGQDANAKAAFLKAQQELMQQFGTPEQTSSDRIRKLRSFFWQYKNTQITLNYFTANREIQIHYSINS